MKEETKKKFITSSLQCLRPVISCRARLSCVTPVQIKPYDVGKKKLEKRIRRKEPEGESRDERETERESREESKGEPEASELWPNQKYPHHLEKAERNKERKRARFLREGNNYFSLSVCQLAELLFDSCSQPFSEHRAHSFLAHSVWIPGSSGYGSVLAGVHQLRLPKSVRRIPVCDPANLGRATTFSKSRVVMNKTT